MRASAQSSVGGFCTVRHEKWWDGAVHYRLMSLAQRNLVGGSEWPRRDPGPAGRVTRPCHSTVQHCSFASARGRCASLSRLIPVFSATRGGLQDRFLLDRQPRSCRSMLPPCRAIPKSFARTKDHRSRRLVNRFEPDPFPLHCRDDSIFVRVQGMSRVTHRTIQKGVGETETGT